MPASATGAAKPTVAESRPAMKSKAGPYIRVRKLYSPLERGNIVAISGQQNAPHRATPPPTNQSNSRMKPDVMSVTWDPRLVNTPTPIMSATTMAVAVNVETAAAWAFMAGISASRSERF